MAISGPIGWTKQVMPRMSNRESLVEVLEAYNKRIGNTGAALEHVAALGDKQTLAVVGGQQAGLFGGQLMILYKAITIIQLAREWSAKLHRAVVPIFWIAGEDHDFDEVNHVHVLSNAQQIEKLKVEHPTGLRTSVSRLPLSSEAWEEALNKLDQSLMDTEFKASLLDKMRSVLRRMARRFQMLLLAGWRYLFGEYGLVLIDADEPELRALESSCLKGSSIRMSLCGITDAKSSRSQSSGIWYSSRGS